MSARNKSPEPCDSDAESRVSGDEIHDDNFSQEESRLTRLSEHERSYKAIENRLVSSLGFQPPPEVVTVYQRNLSSSPAQANSRAFQVYLRALETKNCGDANVRYAWFGAPKAEIEKIVSHGFGHEQINRSSGLVYGHGVHLSPDESPLPSVQSATEDENGLRHLLFCKVLLGKVEAIQPGSNQTHPSSAEFDSGVDNVVSPKRYIVWSTNINTHILPEFIVSIRAATVIDNAPIPRSPWMSFSSLFAALSPLLDPNQMSSINQHYTDFTEKRVSREELVRRIRRVAGDELLATVIKSFTHEGD